MFSSPLADWYLQKWHWLKLRRACLSYCVVVHYYLTSHCRLSCNHHETIGGTVLIMKLEKVDMIDEKHHQENSLEDSWKARHESWPVMFLSLPDWKWCLAHSFLRISPWKILGLMTNKKCCILHWIEKFTSGEKLNKIGLTILSW